MGRQKRCENALERIRLGSQGLFLLVGLVEEKEKAPSYDGLLTPGGGFLCSEMF